MANSPTGSDASHESDNDEHNENGSKNSAVKDKACPYCSQRFTSSSLGRHLDQFLSKKKPDGIHDVEEIKRLRAGITRRTARGKKGEHGEQHDGNDRSTHVSPGLSSNSGPTPSFMDSSSKNLAGPNDVRFNRMGWQSTGVIPDSVPPNGSSAIVPSPQLPQGDNSMTGSKRSFSAYAADLPAASANETARALELSLREVLDTVTVALKRAEPLPQPFPFELASMSFPALCIALLPTPATLFQANPFATNTTIPLKPPGFDQLEALRHKIRVVLEQWKWDALAHVQRISMQDGMNVGEEAERLTQTTQKHIAESMRHLDAAFQFFMSNAPDQQYQMWSIELLRAYKSEHDKLKEAKEQVSRITQETSQLQQQIDYLSRCQWPREMALWPPERNPLSSVVAKEEKKSSLDTVSSYGTTKVLDSLSAISQDRWDFDKLVNKWKRHVREDRARRGGSGSMLPPITDNMDTARTDTPPTSMRKAMSDVAQNGASNSTGNSPTVRNGHHPSGLSLGITDRPLSFANAGTNANSQKPFAGTPTNNSSISRTQTPTNHPMANVQIISDVDEHMSRFAPWYQQQRELEAREREEDVGG